MNKPLTVRYLIRLIGMAAVVAAAIYLLHRRQAGKQAAAFLYQADAAEQRGDLARAAGYLRRALALRPNDTDGRARLGLLLADTAQSADDRLQAFLELEQVLRVAPERTDVRRRNIELALDPRLGRHAEALGHIDYLLARNPDDGTIR